MSRLIRVGSRDSVLALAQTNWVINEIKKKYPDYQFEIITMKTKGDKILETRLDKIGGKGLFVKELETGLINNQVDMVVHSMKDMPAQTPDELCIDIVSKREDPRDVLITNENLNLNQLKEGFVLGTSSIRREAQILCRRKDANIKTLRGNIVTRLEKLKNKEYDAIILAAAGIKRLKLDESYYCINYFSKEDLIPAPGQGALCVQTRKNDDIEYLNESIYCKKAAMAIKAERGFVKQLDGNCSMPIAAHAILIDDENIKIQAMIASDDIKHTYRDELIGNKNEPELLGIKLARILKERKDKERR